MRYPKINRQARRVINVPRLSGGLNLRDSITTVKDDQMTDCVNMWYKNGMLRTRPPFTAKNLNYNDSDNMNNVKSVGTQFYDKIKVVYNGCECVLASNMLVFTGENNEEITDIEFEFQGKGDIFPLPKISGIIANNIKYFCVETGGVLYCYVSDYSIWKLEYGISDKKNSEFDWIKVGFEDIYVPTVYIHCQRKGWNSFTGVQFEGFNIIGNRYKMIYSAYNENDSDISHPMRYALGKNLPKCGEIIVDFTSYDTESDCTQTVQHKISYTEEQYLSFSEGGILVEKFKEKEGSKDGLYLFVKYNYVGFLFEPIFTFENGVANIVGDDLIQKYGHIEDNVVINVPYVTDEKNLKKIFGMSQSIWFGGIANGINGGSRLFLCGNKYDDEKSLVVWSGLNNPLYFSENCYTYIGNNSHATTAFGKQGENLIIFKENSIYSTCYQQNNSIDAEDLIDQTVIDFDANSTYFPIVLVNGYIGCDCPNTIQMCRNRLVWASSEGKIYTLCTINQYNEHTVYELSDMVVTVLNEYKNLLKSATSADFAGHYILFLGNCALVMDYCNYGYQYVYSYSKNEDANVLIPWYFWRFDFLEHDEQNYSKASICTLDGMMILRTYFETLVEGKYAFIGFTMDDREYSNMDKVSCDNMTSDILWLDDKAIESSLTTKLFDLGGSIYNINVDSVGIKLGANNVSDIMIGFITEQGEEKMILKNKHDHTELTSLSFMRGNVLRPNIRNITKFGLSVMCKGQLCIDELSFKYRVLGGIK